MDHLSNGRTAEPGGNHDPYAKFLVNDVFRTTDGEIAVTVRHAADTARVAAVTNADIDGLALWCEARSAADAVAALQAAGIPASRVQNAHHMVTDDEQSAARGFFQPFESPIFGTRLWERFPARLSESSIEPYALPPSFVGEHASLVLGGVCGMTDDEIANAKADGRLV